MPFDAIFFRSCSGWFGRCSWRALSTKCLFNFVLVKSFWTFFTFSNHDIQLVSLFTVCQPMELMKSRKRSFIIQRTGKFLMLENFLYNKNMLSILDVHNFFCSIIIKTMLFILTLCDFKLAFSCLFVGQTEGSSSL